MMTIRKQCVKLLLKPRNRA